MGESAMLFPTFEFTLFFVVVFSVYWLLRPHRARMAWLLAASVFFYMMWNPWLILLLLFSAFISYATALALERNVERPLRVAWLVGSITVVLSLLAYFKYANFFLESARSILGSGDLLGNSVSEKVLLPLGISFYTFESISYITDVYWGRSKAIRDPFDYALFILFFPRLVAGPIVRSRDFFPQIHRPKRWNWLRGYIGMRQFLIGLFKKAVLADHLAAAVDPVFAAPVQFGSTTVWVAVFAYSVQIYCDFSGYSDMAIGLAHLFDFRLPRNFYFPYLATDLADFWRRWHISLSSWLRDYLYISLGGNRHGSWRTCPNLVIVMALGGLWHGANWTFIAWGLFHGFGLVLQRSIPWPRSWRADALRPFWIFATFLLVSLGWVLFRAQSLSDAGVLFSRLAFWSGGESLKTATALLVVVTLGVVALEHSWFGRSWRILPERNWSAPVVGTGFALVAVLILMAFPYQAKTFIYFQF